MLVTNIARVTRPTPTRHPSPEPDPAAAQTPARSARAERTREALQRAALELFAANGYDATTTAQVARRAGVTEMTLFRHFATKSSLVLDDPYDPVMADAVRGRPADESPMRAVAEAVRASWSAIPGDAAAQLRTRLRIIAGAPSLQGALDRSGAATVTALSEALGDRGVPPLEARTVAAAVIAGLSAALLHWAGDNAAGDLSAALGRALDALAQS